MGAKLVAQRPHQGRADHGVVMRLDTVRNVTHGQLARRWENGFGLLEAAHDLAQHGHELLALDDQRVRRLGSIANNSL
ncbi:hypothetical protein ATE48_04450 [Candidatus Viadribacter manganicus]|uniref:Uncharacterized protein n=1 Tax=Candidatus Viadribacter manganicus TaxID=1759059 RepID=A0A1B1AF87_9PROT|nr:hypothetical protein [Candidatus Viadribacter manganicus]ANP45220.1 hypothetical protein ATE48_04450 [Candidatus Viadribacter manganicus]